MTLNYGLKRKIAVFALTGFAAMTLVGCGSSSSTPAAGGSKPGVVKILGKAVKGRFRKNSTISISRMKADGTKGTQLGSGSVTADDGSYEIDFSDYTGPVLIEAYGTYADEATGVDRTVVETAPVKSIAVAPSVDDDKTQNVTAHVTPLTHMVVANVVESAKNSKISTEDTDMAKSFINLRSLSIADAFGLGDNFDVLSKEPATESTNDSTKSTAYGIILAGISQLLKDDFSNDYASFATNSTSGILSATDPTSTGLQNAVTKALVSLASNDYFTTNLHPTISTEALTSATNNIKQDKIVNPQQHEFAKSLVIASTPITTAETTSITATMQTTSTTASSELSYKWSVGIKGTEDTITYVSIQENENTTNSESLFGLITVPADSVSETSAVSFWATNAGEYSVKVEVSRDKFKTVTATANILVLDQHLGNLIGKTFYLMDEDYNNGINTAAASGKAVFGTDRALTVTEDPDTAYNRSYNYVSHNSLVIETGQWHYSNSVFYMWDIESGSLESQSVSTNVTDELGVNHILLSGQQHNNTRFYETAAQRNAAVKRYNILKALITSTDFNNKTYKMFSSMGTSTTTSATAVFGAGPGELSISGDITALVSASPYSYNATTDTSNWYYSEEQVTYGDTISTNRIVTIGETLYQNTYRYSRKLDTDPWSFSYIYLGGGGNSYYLCISTDSACISYFEENSQ